MKIYTNYIYIKEVNSTWYYNKEQLNCLDSYKRKFLKWEFIHIYKNFNNRFIVLY